MENSEPSRESSLSDTNSTTNPFEPPKMDSVNQAYPVLGILWRALVLLLAVPAVFLTFATTCMFVSAVGSEATGNNPVGTVLSLICGIVLGGLGATMIFRALARVSDWVAAIKRSEPKNDDGE